jgi:hypothetical protein
MPPLAPPKEGELRNISFGELFPSFGGAGGVKNKLQSPKNSTDILQ